MFKRAVSVILILVLLPQFAGCTSVKAVDLTDVERPASEKVYGVITVDGEWVHFDRPSTEVRNDTIYATVDESPYAIALDEVQQLRLRRFSIIRTVVAGMGVAALIVGVGVVIAFASWERT